MTRLSLDKVAFVLSSAVLAFLYGIATHAFGWFPSPQLERAWHQARQEFGEPLFVSRRVYDREGVRVVDPERAQPGLTLISTFWEDSDWGPELRLIDRKGETVHQWDIEPVKIFGRSGTSGLFNRKLKDRNIFGSKLYPNGDVVINIMYVGTARLDACGDVLWKHPVGSHHSIATGDDGSFWVPTLDRGKELDSSSTLVDSLAIAYPNSITHISRHGEEVLDTINVLSVLERNDLEYLVPKHQLRVDSDVTHLNDVEPLSASLAHEYPRFEAGDILVSLRDLHLIFVMNPKTRQIKWHYTNGLNMQHDPDFMGDGWIGVFDNNTDGTKRGTVLGGSRIVAVQPHTDSTKVLFPTERSDHFYTGGGGKWQQLDNGNLLLTESQGGRVVEVAPDGSTVWEWITEPYDDATIPEVTEGTHYDLTSEHVSGWACSPLDASDENPESDS